jgi:hypothetical protein
VDGIDGIGGCEVDDLSDAVLGDETRQIVIGSHVRRRKQHTARERQRASGRIEIGQKNRVEPLAQPRARCAVLEERLYGATHPPMTTQNESAVIAFHANPRVARHMRSMQPGALAGNVPAMARAGTL